MINLLILIRTVNKLIYALLQKDFVKKLLDDNVAIIKRNYIKDSQMRELMFEVVDLSSTNLIKKITRKVDENTNLLLDYERPNAVS